MSNISNKVVNSLFKTLSTNGSDVQKLLDICGISEYELSRIQGRVSRHSYAKLMTQLYQQHKYFLLTELVKNPQQTLSAFYSTFPELVSYCLNSTTPRQLIMRYLEFRFVVGSCDQIIVTNNGLETRLRYTDEFLSDKTSYSAMANFLNLLCMLNTLEPHIKVNINLTGNPQINKSVLNNAFNTHIEWKHQYNDMYISNSYLDTELNSFNENLFNLQREALVSIGKEIETKGSFSFIIEDQIRAKIEKNSLDSDTNLLNEVCEGLNISRWTLYRKLTHEQTSFSALLKKVRLEMSLHLLLDSKRSVQEISDLTGFGSSSAFSRFFYSNMGVAPLYYRKERAQ